MITENKTSFYQDDTSKKRAFYYKLEEIGFLKLERRKKDKFYEYKWILTKKANKIIKKESQILELLKK